ncbi:glycosyltransferase [Arthrobacter monumenti]
MTLSDSSIGQKPTLHFTVNSLALRRGGLVKAVRERASSLAAEKAFHQVWIDVLGFQPRIEQNVNDLKASGHLHADVNVRSILYSLDESNAGLLQTAASPAFDRLIDETRDHKYERATRFDKQGLVRSVDYFTKSGRLARRDQMNANAQLARVLEFPEAGDGHITQHYIGDNGRCFLQIHQSPESSKWLSSTVFGEHELNFDSMGLLYQYAFEKVLALEQSPVITSEFRETLNNLPSENLDDVVRLLRHPRLRKVAVAHSNHLKPPYVPGSGVSATWQRLLRNIDDIDSLVVLTEAQKEDLANEFGHPEKIEVITHSAPTYDIVPKNIDPNRVVVVARTHPKKRVDEAIRTFRKVLDGNPKAFLEVFGFGYGDAEEAKVVKLIDELDLNQKVRFVPFTSHPGEIYDGACVTLMTSASEGFGLVLLESMSHGVPVVAYDANYGPRDVIIDGQNGFLAAFGDSDILAEKVLEIMGDPNLRTRLGKNAQVTMSKFDRKGFISKWVEVLGGIPPRGGATNSLENRIVDDAWWSGESLVLQAAAVVPAGSCILIEKRGADAPVIEELLNEGVWRFDIPPSGHKDIFDVYVKFTPDERRRRVSYSLDTVQQRGPLKLYATKHGALSLKNVGVQPN